MFYFVVATNANIKSKVENMTKCRTIFLHFNNSKMEFKFCLRP